MHETLASVGDKRELHNRKLRMDSMSGSSSVEMREFEERERSDLVVAANAVQ
jgi:hypothetical protein